MSTHEDELVYEFGMSLHVLLVSVKASPESSKFNQNSGQVFWRFCMFIVFAIPVRVYITPIKRPGKAPNP